MGTVQTMCSTLTSDINNGNPPGGNDNPMNMINSLMANMNTGGGTSGGVEGVPDLSNITSLLGPMLTTLNNNSVPPKRKIDSPKNITVVTEIDSEEDKTKIPTNDLD